uniref:Uncharacterized protein n=1 Tax=Arundo donax TaxID=35708 RepID=A0A0A8YME1_ARUDO
MSNKSNQARNWQSQAQHGSTDPHKTHQQSGFPNQIHRSQLQQHRHMNWKFSTKSPQIVSELGPIRPNHILLRVPRDPNI